MLRIWGLFGSIQTRLLCILSHGLGRFGIIGQVEARKDVQQERCQILIIHMNQIAVFAFGESGRDPVNPIEVRADRVSALMDSLFFELESGNLHHV